MTDKFARIFSNTLYGIGVLITASLCGITIFGSSQIINHEAMIPFTWKESAFMWLAFGAVPMLISCMAVYKFNLIKNSMHVKRNFLLIFFPAFICIACASFIIALLVAGMVNSFILN